MGGSLMVRPSRRVRQFLPRPVAASGTDNGADGIDWDEGPYIPTVPLTVEESDGSPSANPVDTIKLDAADFTLVDNADGSVSVTTDEPDAAAHIADTTDAHDASAVSIADSGGYFTGTDVEAALQELGAGGGGGGGVTVQDEGTPLTTTATTLDFVGAGVTATGAGATKTITIPGGGTSDYVSGASGTGQIIIPGVAGAVDRLPASPNANDDEFAALSGWTNFGSPDTVAANGADYLSRVRIQKTSVPGIAGIYKACPSLPFTVTCRVADAHAYTAVQQWGLVLAPASPGGYMLVGPANANSWAVYACVFSSSTTRTSATLGAVAGGVPMAFKYIRLVVNSSTSVDCYVSHEGYRWIATHGAFNPGFTIGSVGLGISANVNNNAADAYFDWIRFS